MVHVPPKPADLSAYVIGPDDPVGPGDSKPDPDPPHKNTLTLFHLNTNDNWSIPWPVYADDQGNTFGLEAGVKLGLADTGGRYVGARARIEGHTSTRNINNPDYDRADYVRLGFFAGIEAQPNRVFGEVEVGYEAVGDPVGQLGERIQRGWHELAGFYSPSQRVYPLQTVHSPYAAFTVGYEVASASGSGLYARPQMGADVSAVAQEVHAEIPVGARTSSGFYAEGFVHGYVRNQNAMMNFGVPSGAHAYAGFRLGYDGSAPISADYEMAMWKDTRNGMNQTAGAYDPIATLTFKLRVIG